MVAGLALSAVAPPALGCRNLGWMGPDRCVSGQEPVEPARQLLSLFLKVEADLARGGDIVALV